MVTDRKDRQGVAASLRPFQNESDSTAIGDLIIENRTDRIECYGSITITKDKAGLAAALALKEIVDAAVSVLTSEAIPDKIVEKSPKKARNPFS